MKRFDVEIMNFFPKISELNILIVFELTFPIVPTETVLLLGLVLLVRGPHHYTSNEWHHNLSQFPQSVFFLLSLSLFLSLVYFYLLQNKCDDDPLRHQVILATLSRFFNTPWITGFRKYENKMRWHWWLWWDDGLRRILEASSNARLRRVAYNVLLQLTHSSRWICCWSRVLLCFPSGLI